MRDSNPNKLLLSELFAYVAKPTKHAKTTFLTAIVLICVDSGASSTCTMNRNDFLPETLLSHQWTCHQWCVSLSSSLEVFGVRTVRWVIHNDDLEPIDVEIERSLLLIRDIPMCLLCPQDLAQQTGHHILLLLLAMALFETHLTYIPPTTTSEVAPATRTHRISESPAVLSTCLLTPKRTEHCSLTRRISHMPGMPIWQAETIVSAP